ncbi:hypothetical protein [Rubripirellula reticaptiva]|uniref:Uncharacterized protein n=1 Tax=Rubripirellula reticaptiva TaxID=2528013 RepID=A0A5C6F638_9BACT|nr:hypothetical protein [Rubripirellula reticaptiva]TWU55897.1 hypothetical protein Poly59_22000 [Rubripirellula reticaptiva]
MPMSGMREFGVIRTLMTAAFGNDAVEIRRPGDAYRLIPREHFMFPVNVSASTRRLYSRSIDTHAVDCKGGLS